MSFDLDVTSLLFGLRVSTIENRAKAKARTLSEDDTTSKGAPIKKPTTNKYEKYVLSVEKLSAKVSVQVRGQDCNVSWLKEPDLTLISTPFSVNAKCRYEQFLVSPH